MFTQTSPERLGYHTLRPMSFYEAALEALRRRMRRRG